MKENWEERKDQATNWMKPIATHMAGKVLYWEDITSRF